MMSRYAAVIFDMDGLLLDTERVVLRGFEAACDELGCVVGFDVFARMIGRNYRSSRPILEEALAGQVAIETFEAVCRRHVQAIFEDGVPVKSGVIDLLAHLRKIDMPMAVATSTETARAREKLKKAELLEAFQHVVGGDQVERSKPDPDIYLEAARRLSANPAASVALEDSENGVRAAHAAGMTVIQVPDLIQPSDSLRMLGHTIAADVLVGARQVGLLGSDR
ncbi:MAG: HAD family phosphatase [Pseudomonadota bacterium]